MDDRVLWYPGYTDKFVTLTFGHGQDVKLYKVTRVSEVNLVIVVVLMHYCSRTNRCYPEVKQIRLVIKRVQYMNPPPLTLSPSPHY
jgi:hypothetical protein